MAHSDYALGQRTTRVSRVSSLLRHLQSQFATRSEKIANQDPPPSVVRNRKQTHLHQRTRRRKQTEAGISGDTRAPTFVAASKPLPNSE